MKQLSKILQVNDCKLFAKMKPSCGKPSHFQSGYTLIELMIAMLIGLFVISGVIQLFINTKQSYRMQDALSRLQENGRFAMDFIGRDIRLADFKQCPFQQKFVSPDMAVKGENGVTTTTPDSPDTLNVRSLTSTTCSDNTSTGSYFNITGSTSSIPYTLLSSASSTSPVVEGVENMQILFGIDSGSDGTPDYYVEPAAAGATPTYDPNKITTVQVSLLMRTVDDNIASRPLSYTFNGETVSNPGDRRIRRVFTSTFALRNRLP